MIKIYTISDKRPDLLKVQYYSLLTHLRDKKFEFIVCNNGCTFDLRNEIKSICDDLKITHYYLSQSPYNSTSLIVEYAIKQCIKSFIINDKESDITVIIDSDIFLFSPFSISELLGDHLVAGIYQQREKKINRLVSRNHYYMWNALMIFNHKKMNYNEFDISMIEGLTDTGGKTNYFIKKYFNKIKWLKHTPGIGDSELIIFSSDVKNIYDKSFGIQIIEDSFIHYYRGSNWDSKDNTYHERKTRFLIFFLSYTKERFESLFYGKLWFNHIYGHTRKNFNGIDDNLNMNYKHKSFLINRFALNSINFQFWRLKNKLKRTLRN